MRDILERYAHGAAQRLGPDTFCSITLQQHDDLFQVASSDVRAAECDRVETDERRGPCILAMSQLHSVVVGDTQTDDRWPTWQHAALRRGFRSSVALPAYVDDHTTVAVNMYSEQLDTWTRDKLVGMDTYVQEIADIVRAQLAEDDTERP